MQTLKKPIFEENSKSNEESLLFLDKIEKKIERTRQRSMQYQQIKLERLRQSQRNFSIDKHQLHENQKQYY